MPHERLPWFQQRLPWFQMLYLRGSTMANSLNLRAKLKQCIGFYQVATNIPEVRRIDP